MNSKNASSNIIKLQTNFGNIVEARQSCKLRVVDNLGNSWNFYFKNGSLLWAMASEHRARRIVRIVGKHCPQVNCEEIQLREQEISELREYLMISVLNKREEISEADAVKVIEEMVSEVLFDCFLSSSQIAEIKSIFETSANRMGAILRSPLFKQPLVYLDLNKIFQGVEARYQKWLKAGLASYSPNSAPVIKNSEKLQQELNAKVYEKLSALIDGKKTLRDLAIIAKQDLLTLSCSLIPYVKNKSLELTFISDKQLPNLFYSAKQNAVNRDRANPDRDYVEESSLPLIVCVDDRPEICQQMAQILNPAGYRLIPVSESVNALGVVLEHKPVLIFLDLIMPVANGYELCSQIRRISAFKATPIVILTGNDGIIDRVRAKMVGATDFICKPIKQKDILAITQKYVLGVLPETALSQAEY